MIKDGAWILPGVCEPLHTLLFRMVSSSLSLVLNSANSFLSSGCSSLFVCSACPKQTTINTNRYITPNPRSSLMLTESSRQKLYSRWRHVFSLICLANFSTNTKNWNYTKYHISHIDFVDCSRFCFDGINIPKVTFVLICYVNLFHCILLESHYLLAHKYGIKHTDMRK